LRHNICSKSGMGIFVSFRPPPPRSGTRADLSGCERAQLLLKML
jgi:hypothetical protein